ncbi:MAG: YraN family protein [Methylomicrobium sp.]
MKNFIPKPAKAQHLLTGESAEEQAYRYLIDQGLKPVARNYRCQLGELDLIMKDNNTLAVIEVRYRRSDKYGSALESVTSRKQSRIIAATQMYLAQHKTSCPIRFDVVAITADQRIDWIKNAFITRF